MGDKTEMYKEKRIKSIPEIRELFHTQTGIQYNEENIFACTLRTYFAINFHVVFYFIFIFSRTTDQKEIT